MKHRTTRVAGLVLALAMTISACGDDADGTVDAGEQADATTDEDATSDEPAEEEAEPTEETAEADAGESAVEGNGVILADLCAGGQPLNGGVSIDDLVSYGIFTSTDVSIESNSAYDASLYETFGFICNITEDVGDGENTLTIGVNPGSDTFQISIDQNDVPIEMIGEWEVILSSNWTGPLAMRGTDSAGQQHSVYAMWTPADGSIPDAETLERLMRPLAEGLAANPIEIPSS